MHMVQEQHYMRDRKKFLPSSSVNYEIHFAACLQFSNGKRAFLLTSKV